MAGPVNDPLDSFLNSIRVVKNPLESNFREAVKNLKHCFNGFVKHVNLSGAANYLVLEQVTVNLNAKKKGQNVVIGEKGEFRIEVFFGMYTENCDCNDHCSINFIRDDVEKVDNKNDSCYDGEIKSNELKNEIGKDDLSFECLKMFLFDKLSHFPMFDVGVQDYDEDRFDHFKALFSELEGKREIVDGFLTNLQFARIGGVFKPIVWGTNGGKEAPRSFRSEAAVVVPPADSVLRSALAGGLSCALSAAIMHPVDTVKTWVQASTLTFPEVISKLPQFGVRALYRGSIPAILGQFSSHGLRTGICEVSKLMLVNVAPSLPEMQVRTPRL
ncbi:hypothetical protein PHJA_002499100 [Phtheirospermum japonicum]|uniref:Mitochondrial carrier protein n=1 Tax=Phtheirospermum japonicum TaxID=374723 RepID=A0A830CZ24_9LAMI|nr:hypothetical protein PHJA_002499100 [Phtheirospermum japonicum]